MRSRKGLTNSRCCMKVSRLLLVILGAAMLSGCMTQRVLVVDAANRPIAGAVVEPISLSINYTKVTTSANGKVALPRVLQKIEWVSVTKEGFKPSGPVPVRPENPMVITLSPMP